MSNNEEDWLKSEPEQPPSSTFWFEPQSVKRADLPGEGEYSEILLDALDRELNQYRQLHGDTGDFWFTFLDSLNGKPLDERAHIELSQLSTTYSYSPATVGTLSAKVTLFASVKIEVTNLAPVQANWRTLTVRKLDS
jgi:hypothetical protein